MVSSPRESHEFPEDKPEGHEKAETNKYFAVYQQAAGSLSAADFQKVSRTASSRKLVGLAQEAGISHEFRQMWATSIIGALGRTFVAEKGDRWLRNEADAFYAAQNSGTSKVNADITQGVEEIASTTQSRAEQVSDDSETAKNFAEYQAHRGSLDRTTYENVVKARYTKDVYGAAMSQIISFGKGVPDNSMVEMAAKLKTVLAGDPRLDNEAWLMPELYILLKRY